MASLAAPKPMLFFAGEEDPLFPLPAVQASFDRMQAVWEAHGAGGKLETRIWPSGHVFYEEPQEAAFDWLDRVLRPVD